MNNSVEASSYASVRAELSLCVARSNFSLGGGGGKDEAKSTWFC